MKNTSKGPLDNSIRLYLAHKHSLGKQLAKVGPMLRLLDSYLYGEGIETLDQITTTQISAFIASRHRPSPRSYNALIGAVRGLLDWMVAHELLLESPMHCQIRRLTSSRLPFLFSLDQVRCLLALAEQLPSYPRAQTRGQTYKVIFTLLYGLGLRVGEVSRLCRKDIDLDHQLLVINQTKFGKDRFVPFGPKMGRALTDYLTSEELSFGPMAASAAAFSFDKQKPTPISTNTISSVFHKLLLVLQITPPLGVVPPHLHCLRHSFAVATLLRWYRAGVDPMSRLFDLSTFLGHVNPSSTSVYLTITTELLECANERFVHFGLNSRKESVR